MKTKSSTSKNLVWLVGTLVALFVLILFVPNILYLGVRTGLMQLAQPLQVLKLNIEFSSNWFPLASNESMLGKFLVARSDIPTIIYYKNDWLAPWGSSMVAVSKLQNIGGNTVSGDLQNQENSKQFKWGYVIAQSQHKSKDAIKVFLIPKYGAVIATRDPDSLEAIQKITANEEYR